MKATIEMIESSYDTPGHRFSGQQIEFDDLPEVGKTFRFVSDDGYPCGTGRVTRMRKFGENEIRFFTKRSLYGIVLDAPSS